MLDLPCRPFYINLKKRCIYERDPNAICTCSEPAQLQHCILDWKYFVSTKQCHANCLRCTVHLLTYCGLVTHTGHGQHWLNSGSDLSPVKCQAISWTNWPLGDILIQIHFQWSTFESVTSKMSAIVFRSQCVKWTYHGHLILHLVLMHMWRSKARDDVMARKCFKKNLGL